MFLVQTFKTIIQGECKFTEIYRLNFDQLTEELIEEIKDQVEQKAIIGKIQEGGFVSTEVEMLRLILLLNMLTRPAWGE
jgi:hypothetical protein